MIKKEAIELLQYRIQQEQLSSRIYEQMSLWLDNNGYSGATKLYSTYASEELKHAEWAKEYLLAYGITPELRKLDAIECEYAGLPDIINQTYDHEAEITRQCEELATKAMAMSDHGLYNLASKYCHEQTEEMSKAQTLKDYLRAFGEDKTTLLLLDEKLGDL
jgi:ferritin